MELLERDFFFFKPIRYGELNFLLSACIISLILQYLSFASSCCCAELTHSSQMLYRDITAPWLSSEMSKVPAEKHLPRCHMWQTSSLRQQSNPLARVIRHCIRPEALQVRRDKVTCPSVPAGAVPTIPTQRHCKQRARAGTRRSWASLCQIDYG